MAAAGSPIRIARRAYSAWETLTRTFLPFSRTASAPAHSTFHYKSITAGSQARGAGGLSNWIRAAASVECGIRPLRDTGGTNERFAAARLPPRKSPDPAREGPPAAHPFAHHDHPRWLRPSHHLSLRRGYRVRPFLPRHAFRPETPGRPGRRPFCPLQGTRRPAALRGAGRGGRLSRRSPGHPPRILERTGRPSHAAHPRRGRGHRLSRPGALRR